MFRHAGFIPGCVALGLWLSITVCGASVDPDQLKCMKQLIEDGKFNQARELIVKNTTSGRTDARFRLINAELLRLTGRTDDAINEYQTAAVLAPTDPSPLIALAELHRQNLQLDKSLACARQALELKEQSTAARVVYASVLLQSDQTAEGERQIKKLLEAEPENPEVQLLVYQLGRKKGDFQSARRALEFVVAKSAKGDPHWLVELADLHEAEGDYGGARDKLEALVAAAPGYLEARNRLARLLEFRFHDFGSATSCYTDLLKADPQSSDAAGGIDRCRRKQRDIAYRMKSTLKESIQSKQ